VGRIFSGFKLCVKSISCEILKSGNSNKPIIAVPGCFI
jgi:hypothetical protein